MSWSDEATIWMSRSAMNMPTHITMNGPRLHTQLGSEAVATDGAAVEGMAAAVMARSPEDDRVSTPTFAERPGLRPRSIGSSSSLMRTGTR